MAKESKLLSKRYLSDEVSKTIKEQIFNLQYHRGERLKVETLASDLGVSMTPVREGLKDLAAQGIVEYDGKTYSVFNPSKKEIQDIFDIRRYLEKLSAATAAQNITEDQLKQLYEMQYTWLDKENVTLREFIDFDIEFHGLLVKGTNNPRLIGLTQSISEQNHLVRLWSYEHNLPKESLHRTVSEHILLLDAIKEHDSKKAESLMEKQLLKGEGISWKMYESYERGWA